MKDLISSSYLNTNEKARLIKQTKSLHDIRKNEVLQNINNFKRRINTKYEIEKLICIKYKKLRKLREKWKSSK